LRNVAHIYAVIKLGRATRSGITVNTTRVIGGLDISRIGTTGKGNVSQALAVTYNTTRVIFGGCNITVIYTIDKGESGTILR
jgi:hypothetical protein